MKCPVCEYEPDLEVKFFEVPVFYKTGKRQGELKKKEKKCILPKDEMFIEIELLKPTITKTQYNNTYYGDVYLDKEEISFNCLYMCPKCKSVRGPEVY